MIASENVTSAATLHVRLTLLDASFAVCRLDADAPLPSWAEATNRALASVTRTPRELSIVVEDACVPRDVRREGPFRAFEVAGPLPLDLVGVIASLADPLRDAGVPIFVLSTVDTDYVLVPAARLEAAVAALQGAGHDVAGR